MITPAFRNPSVLWPHVARGFWWFLALAVSLKIIIQGDSHTVYPVYAQASLHWWLGQSLYETYEGLDLYRYSPTFAIVMSPFALLPSRVGNILWTLGSVYALWFAAGLFARTFIARWSPAREAVMSLLVAVASIRMIWNGQSNTLLIALVLLALVAIHRQLWWRASLLLTLPVFIKLWPVALVMLLVVAWPRSLLPRLLAWTSLLLAIPFVTGPATTVLAQYGNWYASLITDYGRWPGFRDLWMVWDVVYPPVNEHIYRGAQLLGALLVLLLSWSIPSTPERRTLKLFVILSAWLCWQLLLGPSSERATYGVLAPCVAFALVNYERRDNWLLVLTFVGLSLFGLGDIERAMAPVLPFSELILPLSPIPFVVWLVRLRLSHHDTAVGDSLR